MKNKFLISITNLDDINDYKKVGISTFLFPLQEFCVGYPKEFSYETINKLKEKNKYVLVNRVLDCDAIDNLKKILPKLKIKGLVFEDIGVFYLAKKLGIKYELIFFPNHFNTNYVSVNTFLDYGLDSVFLSNELTKEELMEITNKALKPVVIHIFGLNQAMYSRRLLLDNYANFYHLKRTNPLSIKENVGDHKFLVYENDYGTVLYDDNIFNGEELLSLNNVLYFYINTSFISKKDVLDFISNKFVGNYKGFLDKETIFKLRGD